MSTNPGTIIPIDESGGHERVELEMWSAVDAVVGWRIWRACPLRSLDERVWALASIADGEGVWPPLAAHVACCRHQSIYGAPQRMRLHEAPDPDCNCGFWAFKRYHEAREAAYYYRATTKTLVGIDWLVVVGRVSLWGRVVECEHGWRGARAYPYALADEGGNSGLVSILAGRYGIDVIPAPADPEPLPGIMVGPPARQPAPTRPRRIRSHFVWPYAVGVGLVANAILVFTGPRALQGLIVGALLLTLAVITVRQLSRRG